MFSTLRNLYPLCIEFLHQFLKISLYRALWTALSYSSSAGSDHSKVLIFCKALFVGWCGQLSWSLTAVVGKAASYLLKKSPPVDVGKLVYAVFSLCESLLYFEGCFLWVMHILSHSHILVCVYIYMYSASYFYPVIIYSTCKDCYSYFTDCIIGLRPA